MKNIVLIGAGGHAKVVLEAINLSGDKVVGFVDPKAEAFASLEKLHDSQIKSEAIISFGGVNPKSLIRRHGVFSSYKIKFATEIHPSAVVSSSAIIGEGSFISAGVIINAGAKIGKNCIINSGAIIEHDADIEDGCHVAPGAIILGDVKIGKCSMIGAGAVVVQGLQIKSGSFIKANSVAK